MTPGGVVLTHPQGQRSPKGIRLLLYIFFSISPISTVWHAVEQSHVPRRGQAGPCHNCHLTSRALLLYKAALLSSGHGGHIYWYRRVRTLSHILLIAYHGVIVALVLYGQHW